MIGYRETKTRVPATASPWIVNRGSKIRQESRTEERVRKMAEYKVLYWKGVPAQVKVYEGKKSVSGKMPDRFQEEIDQIAMEEGLQQSEAYLDEWQWTEKLERFGDAQTVLSQLLQELESEYDSKAGKKE